MPQGYKRKRAQLSKAEQLSILQRDKWLCYWCSRPVVFAPTMKYIELFLRGNGYAGPLALYHPHWTRATSPLLDEIGAVFDHVEPFVLGGICHPGNIVTACSKCNSRKGSSPLDAWGERVIRKPIKGKYGEPVVWDGLSSLFEVLASGNLATLSASERAWLKAIQASKAVSAPSEVASALVRSGAR